MEYHGASGSAKGYRAAGEVQLFLILPFVFSYVLVATLSKLREKTTA